ncbi:hypothetical protein OG864_05735 [Streptomyces sp. NBC_00124]|uniref:hypothetical protein n=1 Tax=Streptomyces sp. NBC_00124 TaxID=2975662 RepID=UPI00225A05E9|nr:hypothetical protein [Streptomyces sp. NBC_00124]MCX5358196.1 hypothetical protein [Streptomyces sp. NBC_00124]
MVSARRALVALVAGERDPDVFSEPAPGTLRGKIPMLNKAPTCFFKVRVMLEAVDRTTARIEGLSAEIDRQPAPYRRRIELLVPIPGSVLSAAEVVPAEIGPDVSASPPWATSPRGPGCAGATTSPPQATPRHHPARRCVNQGRAGHRRDVHHRAKVVGVLRHSPAEPG